ncbi:MAG: DUF4330 domain-containing protein [Clostridia bacterium]|nr:DUF4330 domain-containing protein [Clostridia bacterium]
MKMIDQNGKLFGKINLLDFILLLIVVVLIAGGIYKLTAIDNSVYAPDYQEGTITLRVHSLRSYEVDALQNGDMIAVPKIQQLGKIISIEKNNRVDNVNAADGKIYSVSNPIYYEVDIELKTEEMVCRDGYYYVGKNYRLLPGQALEISSGTVESKATVISVDIKK